MKLQKFKKIVSEASPEAREEVRLAMDTLDRMHDLLHQKFDGKQKLLAEKMGVSEAIVSKWFSGMQNFTLSTIAKLNVAFGEPVLAVCSNVAKQVALEQVTVPGNKALRHVEITGKGVLVETFTPVKMNEDCANWRQNLPIASGA